MGGRQHADFDRELSDCGLVWLNDYLGVFAGWIAGYSNSRMSEAKVLMPVGVDQSNGILLKPD